MNLKKLIFQSRQEMFPIRVVGKPVLQIAKNPLVMVGVEALQESAPVHPYQRFQVNISFFLRIGNVSGRNV